VVEIDMFRFWPTVEVFVEAKHFRSLDRKVPAPAGTKPLARKLDEVRRSFLTKHSGIRRWHR
jgi:hypothetical protein